MSDIAQTPWFRRADLHFPHRSHTLWKLLLDSLSYSMATGSRSRTCSLPDWPQLLHQQAGVHLDMIWCGIASDPGYHELSWPWSHPVYHCVVPACCTCRPCNSSSLARNAVVQHPHGPSTSARMYNCILRVATQAHCLGMMTGWQCSPPCHSCV